MGESLASKLARLRRERGTNVFVGIDHGSEPASTVTVGVTTRGGEVVSVEVLEEATGDPGGLPLCRECGQRLGRATVHPNPAQGSADCSSCGRGTVRRAATSPPEAPAVGALPPAGPPITTPTALIFGEPNYCSGCSAAIQWVILPSGKRCPLDIDPVSVVPFTAVAEEPDPAGGRKEPLLYRPRALSAGVEAVGGWLVAPDVWVDRPRVTGVRSHFATCPHRDKFRRSK